MTVQIVQSNEDVIMWQCQRSEDEPISEPAILIMEYSDVITLKQGDSEVLITKSRKNLLELSKIIKDKANSSDV